MAYVLSRIFILMVWIVKWVIIKTRLIFPALFVAIVLSFFGDWYNANKHLAYAMLAVIITGVAVSWIVMLTNKIKAKRRWHKRDVAYAYRIAGEPMIITKRVNG